MRFVRAVLVLAAAATLALPGTASAAPAACGTSPSHWVGVYDGTRHSEIDGYPDSDIPLDVTISDSAEGLTVTTVLHNGEQTIDQYGDTVIENGRFHWVTARYIFPYGTTTYYDTTHATCGSTGTVTRFNGTMDGWVNTDHVASGTFALTRTS